MFRGSSRFPSATRITSAASAWTAATKAVLIASFFMNALYESKVIRGVIWFLIMVSLTLGDYLTRGWVLKLGGK